MGVGALPQCKVGAAAVSAWTRRGGCGRRETTPTGGAGLAAVESGAEARDNGRLAELGRAVAAELGRGSGGGCLAELGQPKKGIGGRAGRGRRKMEPGQK